MNKGIRASVKGYRITPERSDAEQRRLNKELLESIRALAAEARRNGMTPAKARAIVRELYKERRERRRGR